MPCHRIRIDTARGSRGWVRERRRTPDRVTGRARPVMPATNGSLPGAVEDDLHAEPVVGLGHREPVTPRHVVERADVERLVDLCPTLVVGVHEVGVPVAVGVVHLHDRAGERAGPVVAPEDRDRVEYGPEHPGHGEHASPSRPRGRLPGWRGTHRRSGAGCGPGPRGGLAPRSGRAATGHRGRGRSSRSTSQLVAAVPEPVLDGFGARVPHGGGIDTVCGPALIGRPRPPRRCATHPRRPRGGRRPPHRTGHRPRGTPSRGRPLRTRCGRC